MKCKIMHESAGRMRVHLACRRMSLHQADVLEYYLRNVDGVSEVSVFDRTQDAVIVYRADHAGERSGSVGQEASIAAALSTDTDQAITNLSFSLFHLNLLLFCLLR